ncbi:TMV resistance protein N-like isoform X3 [Lycium ferocissimum]|uniref:TMV resistance protein N-like isoform X3 n=1 Tax=Lycium ferocissimum TaxID=112874 RepID=UPI0028151C7B|nr:TMV resistance protein N-like isoform X3 [Lycium ferocissimum]
MHKVQRWRAALTQLANLKGCDILNRVESASIKLIVGQISSLCKPLLSSPQDESENIKLIVCQISSLCKPLLSSPQDVVESIKLIVGQIPSLCKPLLSSPQDVVGIGTHLEQVKSLLWMEINDIRIVGILGIGGVGKTTVIRAVLMSSLINLKLLVSLRMLMITEAELS